MSKVSRRVEIVLALIAHVLALPMLGIITQLPELLKGVPIFKEGVQATLVEGSDKAGLNQTPEEVMSGFGTLLTVFAVYGIIIFLIALIATFFITSRRVLSAILFLISSISVFIVSYGILWYVALLYLNVAIMLFVRK